MKCRHCETELSMTLVDLGTAPPSNAYLDAQALNKYEVWYPLKIGVCTECWLVQTEDYAHFDELFTADYAYFSSFSSSWLEHAKVYTDEMISRFNLGVNSVVVEVAANDGYLLQYFKQQGIPCYGIEPTTSTAKAAREKGIDIVEDFFGTQLATCLRNEKSGADLMAANNVLAHVPDINDFVAGFALLLKPEGVATFEFPHLLRLIQENQFDTIYHEHFSYLSLTSVVRIFAANNLQVFDVTELSTHGGSLRVFAQRQDAGLQTQSQNVAQILARERTAGVSDQAFYLDFQKRVNHVKNDFVSFLIEAWRCGKKIAAYGAAAKGNTLLNYAGVRADLIDFVVDLNPAKQGKFLPGSRIPIVDENHLKSEQPDYVIIFPWNLKHEITQQLDYIRAWEGKFVVAVPKLEIF